MRIGAVIVNVAEWFPIAAIAAFVVVRTNWFSTGLTTEVWIFLSLILVGNLVWIAIHKGSRDIAKIHQKYPGLRMRR